LLRGTQALSLDLSAIRYSDAPGNRQAKPTGLFSEEACQLAHYAGESPRISSFGIYGCNPSVDKDEQTSQLAAHILWYFVNGFYHRRHEWPQANDANFVKYTIHFRQTKYELHFWKSLTTDRWWMAVPAAAKSGANSQSVFVPCSYLDYQMACNEELPERWVKAYEKLS
jgi:formiminoglutamase